MTSKQFNDLLDKYLRNETTEEEEQLVKNWINALGEDDPLKLSVDQQPPVRNNMLKQIKNHIDLKRQQRKPYRHTKLYILKVAASFLLLLACTFLIWKQLHVQKQFTLPSTESENWLTFKNTDSSSKIINLNDGSEVTLEPDSKIQIPPVFTNNIREVKLLGEAFFKIKRDVNRPFLVYTNNIVTRVLGTSFRIKANEIEKDIVVSVKSGKVSVSGWQGKDNEEFEIVLTPNQKVVFNKQKSSIVKTLVDEPVLIQPQYAMAYKNVAVNTILKDLGKAYNMDIKFDSVLLKNCHITTRMVNENFYDRIDIVCSAIGARYEMSDTSIIVKKTKACN